MSTGSDLIALIASRQNLADYQKKHWDGIVRRVPRHRPARSRGHPDRLPAALRHDPQPRHRGGRREQGEAHPLQVLRRSRQRRPGRHLRPRPDADEPGQHLQERRQGLRHRAARAAAARPGRQLQEHDRPAAEEGPGALLADRRGRALHASPGRRTGPTARRPSPSARCTRSRCT